MDDVVAEAKQRLRETNKVLPTRLIAPGRYLDWLLSQAVPGEPPWQIAVATQAALRQRAADRAQQADQRAAQAAAPDSPARLEARRIAREAAGRSCTPHRR